jgi:hypothetical protein
MKKTIFLIIFFFVSSSIQAESFNLKVFDHNDFFEIQIISSKCYGTCHYLKPSQLVIEAPEDSSMGTIAMDIEADSHILPLISPGQDVGSVEFSKGICLPKINIGQYQIIINDEYYGILFVEKSKVYLSSVFEINYRIK